MSLFESAGMKLARCTMISFICSLIIRQILCTMFFTAISTNFDASKVRHIWLRTLASMACHFDRETV